MKRLMRFSSLAVVTIVVFVAGLEVAFMSETTQELKPFPPPKTEPPIVTPGKNSNDPPSDAIVLFNGKDLSKWRSVNGGEAKWKVQDGYMEVVRRTGDIATVQEFGDCQLHIEWATPAEVKGEGQERGNSGVFLMERYEVQVLDSYNNKTYFHGQAGAIYNQYAPLVNALYGGATEADISTEVTFEDGRKGVLSARVKIRDVATVPVAPSMEKAA